MVGLARTPIALVCLIGGLEACVNSGATPCGGLLCPKDRICAKASSDPSDWTCVSASWASACSGRAEGQTCMLSELGQGTCQAGLCIVGSCGDGVVNGIEACDGSDLNGKTCLDFQSTDAAGLACTPDCSFDKSGCHGYCGDGIKGTAEQCDGADFGGKTCADFSPPGTTNKFYPGGTLSCTVDCMVNIGSCTGGWCGDGIKQFSEACDMTDFGQPPQTCITLNHPGAVTPLVCDPTSCAFTDDSCSCGLNGICPSTTPTCVDNGGSYSCQ
jgi:hypothetical protein